jgi:hypothetical protein
VANAGGKSCRNRQNCPAVVLIVLKRKLERKTGTRMDETTAICLFLSGRRWRLHTDPRTTILQPQMKKYRSLWCMSTTNHKILYLPHIPGILLLNSGICLWKAGNPLAARAFGF